MKPRLTNSILIVLLLLNVGFIATWWFGHWRIHGMMHHHGEDRGVMFLTKELNFDDGQQERMKKIFQEHAGKMQKYQSEILRLQKEMINCLSKDTPDSVHAFMYADSTGIWRIAMQKEFFRNAAAIRQICNPDQKKKYDELMQRVVQKFGHHME